MQQELEQQILKLTAELGESYNDYEALRSRYTKEWDLRNPDHNDTFVKGLQDLANELAHYQKLFKELSSKYAILVSESVAE